jgi:predicted CXXCH cytochrome family protein
MTHLYHRKKPVRCKPGKRFLPGAQTALTCALLLFLVGCASNKTRHEWLTFFFDGVPPEGSEITTAQDSETPQRAKRRPERKNPIKVWVQHTPYVEESCTDCHVSAFSQKLIGTVEEMCFSCHDPFPADEKITHDPVAEGACLECHEAHKSPYPGLLKLPTPQGCYECHENVTEAKFKHEPAIKDCAECHNTHTAKYPGLLKLPTPQGCYECHDNVTEAPFKHEPAIKDCGECHSSHASEFAGLLKLPTPEGCYECHDNVTSAEFKHEPAIKDCNECHTSHASEFAGLLKMESNALCFECHDEDEAQEVEVHRLNPGAQCTVCHDPHGGPLQYYLKHAPPAKSTGAP